MKHEIIFYPVGNGDTSQIILDNKKRILMDFRHIKKSEEENVGPEINLKKVLGKELADANRDYIDVVAFTHGDEDHIKNSTEFFELSYASKYQGEGRIKINTLWVPASMILEQAPSENQSDEFVIWRQEARYRLKKGEGIRVFSKPDRLKEWLKENDLSIDDRKHLITDAGQLAPDFSLDSDGIEFFCHSPFVKHVDENEEFRNEASLIFNIRFKIGAEIYDYLAIGDSKWDILEDIVTKSQKRNNEDRLKWDIFNVPHHSSYLALSDEKGKEITYPKEKIEELLLYGKEGSYLISSSHAIPDNKEAYEQIQPPHIQAKKCYEKYLDKVKGCMYLVTMEESDTSIPQPIKFIIDEAGIAKEEKKISASSIAISKNYKAG
ncbi:hypothetical protein CLV96_3922 [Leptospira meyeri]|uniref:MBL fold metallo-hydrolase n=1 Tax=Leptospira meyeri TaxID=29508 RepID=A0A4V3HHQ0_LEPME|nr:hypothetical protein [Leptospira meyeri]EKJ86179.1 hypothetical protein LEP1GSC017_0006 [Leptospira meyeri serovar Hardjo str. Went 5]TDY66543.1 hypothetical protein CLV96_3922 [Leptospira meyeri]